MIYLDNWGHLFSDESWQELYDFAVKKLKLKPEWNHYSRYFLHFDLTTKNKNEMALRLGALMESEEKAKRREIFKRTQLMNLEAHREYGHIKYWYESKGLHGQKILRVDFAKIGIK